MSDELGERAEVISYERLYRLWEENNWSAAAIDFTVDSEHWRDRLDERQREAALWNYSLFLVGEESVARTLTPVADAAPGYPQQIFLTTQIVDEARHHVFFDRFLREVAGKGTDTQTTLEAMDPYLTWGFRQVFAELDRVTEALRRRPSDLPLLTQTIALYHLVIEGLLAIPGQHFIQRYLKNYELLPGFSKGIDNVSRDESRHVAFGVKFLGDLVHTSDECRSAAIEMWNGVLGWTAGVFIPPNFDSSYVECFGFTLEEIYAFGMRSFYTKIKRIGIDPSEIQMLSRIDPDLPFDERARRVWALIRAGVIGDDRREPQMTPEAFEVLFEGVARSTRIDVARALGGPVEWDFTDAEPWHLVVTDGHVEAKPGRAGSPALRLRVSSADWAKIAVGRTDPRRAVLTRRLRLHGSLANKARLPKLFDR